MARAEKRNIIASRRLQHRRGGLRAHATRQLQCPRIQGLTRALILFAERSEAGEIGESARKLPDLVEIEVRGEMGGPAVESGFDQRIVCDRRGVGAEAREPSRALPVI